MLGDRSAAARSRAQSAGRSASFASVTGSPASQ